MSSVWFLLFCACAVELASANIKLRHNFEEAELHFEAFIEKYNKQYADEHEKQARFQIFKENLAKVKEMNDKTNSSAFGVTQFMDLTIEEFRKMYTGLKVSDVNACPVLTDADVPDVGAPDAFDWRKNNGVTPVKDQALCGCCYAFSAIANIESQYLIKNKVPIDLSEQQVVDCDMKDHGCFGGLMTKVFRFIMEFGGVETEGDYPYVAAMQNCTFDAEKVKVKLAGCNSYHLKSQEKLKQLLYHYGPISVAVKSTALIFIHGDAIIDDIVCDAYEVDHGVLLVGYGDEGVPYWIVKNSWGTDWGDGGYYRMKRGEKALSCGMMNNLMAASVLA